MSASRAAQASEARLLFINKNNKFEIPRWVDPRYYPVFCLDNNGDLIISDLKTNEVKFFTKEGSLSQKFGEFGYDLGLFCYISGLTLTTNHKLIVLSRFGDFKLQIFSCV